MDIVIPVQTETDRFNVLAQVLRRFQVEIVPDHTLRVYKKDASTVIVEKRIAPEKYIPIRTVIALLVPVLCNTETLHGRPAGTVYDFSLINRRLDDIRNELESIKKGTVKGAKSKGLAGKLSDFHV